MVIGTDISLQVCKNEGYLMVKFDGRKPFDRTKEYNVFWYLPDYVREDLGLPLNQSKNDHFVSFDSLAIIYQKYQKGLDSFAETGAYINFENPTYHDLLSLASDIQSYCGLD